MAGKRGAEEGGGGKTFTKDLWASGTGRSVARYKGADFSRDAPENKERGATCFLSWLLDSRSNALRRQSVLSKFSL